MIFLLINILDHVCSATQNLLHVNHAYSEKSVLPYLTNLKITTKYLNLEKKRE